MRVSSARSWSLLKVDSSSPTGLARKKPIGALKTRWVLRLRTRFAATRPHVKNPPVRTSCTRAAKIYLIPPKNPGDRITLEQSNADDDIDMPVYPTASVTGPIGTPLDAGARVLRAQGCDDG